MNFYISCDYAGINVSLNNEYMIDALYYQMRLWWTLVSLNSDKVY